MTEHISRIKLLYDRVRDVLDGAANSALAIQGNVDVLETVVSDIEAGIPAAVTAEKTGAPADVIVEAAMKLGRWLAQSQRATLASAPDDFEAPDGYPREYAKAIRAVAHADTSREVLVRYSQRAFSGGTTVAEITHLSSFLLLWRLGYSDDFVGHAEDSAAGNGGIPGEVTVELIELCEVARDDLIGGATKLMEAIGSENWEEARHSLELVAWAAQGPAKRVRDLLARAASGNRAAAQAVRLAASKVAATCAEVTGATLDDFIDRLAEAGPGLYRALWGQYRSGLEMSGDRETREWLREIGVTQDVDRLITWARLCHGGAHTESVFKEAIEARDAGDPEWETILREGVAVGDEPDVDAA